MFGALNEAVRDAFGVPIVWISGSTRTETAPDGSPLTGIYDSRHYDALDDDAAGLSTRQTTISVVLADLPGVARGDEIETAAEGAPASYRVVDIRADGQGMAALVLEKS